MKQWFLNYGTFQIDFLYIICASKDATYVTLVTHTIQIKKIEVVDYLH